MGPACATPINFGENNSADPQPEDIQQLYYIIDWELMESKYWHDTDEDNSRKRRRQAEFLIHKFCPWRLVKEIGVMNNDVKIKVQENYNIWIINLL